jgi:hypothetical protein
MARMRFTKPEREAFTPGTRVEWQNGSRWKPARVTGEITRQDGWDSVQCRYEGPGTRTIGHGARVDPGPGHVRLLPESGAAS